MNYDLLIQKLNELEQWLESTKGQYRQYPLRLAGYTLLIAVMMISNLMAVIRWPIVRLLSNPSDANTTIQSNTVHNVDEQQLQTLLKSKNVVLVDFWAEWCGPCIMMNKSLNRIAKSDDIGCTIAKVNTVTHPNLADKYNVKGLPTLLLFKDGTISKRFAGALSYSEIKAFITDP
ncbi:MAG: thioredoxin family protein [Fodinibius sp.]|nr:thioredoxin family protein [Fodinibius sp.]